MAIVYETTPRNGLYRGTQIVWYIFYIIEIILFFRFLLRLIGANEAAGFTSFIYNLSYPLVRPFLYVIESPVTAGSVMEWSTLLAIFVYWLIAWAIVSLMLTLSPREL